MLTCFSMNAAGFFKEYMEFRGKVGTETVAGGIAITESKTYGTFLYYDDRFTMYDLRTISIKSIGKGKYQIKFKVELNGQSYGTWSVTFNSLSRTITGTMKDNNGKSLKIDLYEKR